jgi:glyoxylase-like metal-dependent hydrolase (beta-lactamase superfamily II)
VSLELRGYTVGPVQENCFFAKLPGATAGVVVDPGDEADKLIAELADFGMDEVAAILLTHTHFDHVGAVAPLARHSGAPVYCPALETQVLADIMSYVPWAGFGPYESWEAEETVAGGEHLSLAGIELDVVFTPGHSPGHVTYAVPDAGVLFSGDVLFQGSVGRVDLPGGDWPTLAASIQGLLDAYPDETQVLPGHMGVTTLGQERASNPFLGELSHS